MRGLRWRKAWECGRWGHPAVKHNFRMCEVLGSTPNSREDFLIANQDLWTLKAMSLVPFGAQSSLFIESFGKHLNAFF